MIIFILSILSDKIRYLRVVLFLINLYIHMIWSAVLIYLIYPSFSDILCLVFFGVNLGTWMGKINWNWVQIAIIYQFLVFFQQLMLVFEKPML